MKAMFEIYASYAKLLRSIDDWFARCTVDHGDEVACRSGCSECCRGLFDITLLDAWYLKQGFDRLPADVRTIVLDNARERVAGLQRLWPDFTIPYVLNVRPEEQWEELMPDDDEIPCVLLDESGRCRVYDHRPMTCRLHGLPLVDVTGEVLHDEWCTLNFVGSDPLVSERLRGDFEAKFREEVTLFRLFALNLLGREVSELDTFIPAALLIDYDAFSWDEWVEQVKLVANECV